MESKDAAYERRDQLVAGLRELADLYERNGVDKLPLPYNVSIQLDVTVQRPKVDREHPWEMEPNEVATKRAMKRAIRGMGRGRKEKVYSDYAFVVNREITPMVLLQVQTSRAAVCRKVPTGVKIKHPAHTYTTEARVEEEFKWECDDPIFAAPEEPAA